MFEIQDFKVGAPFADSSGSLRLRSVDLPEIASSIARLSVGPAPILGAVVLSPDLFDTLNSLRAIAESATRILAPIAQMAADFSRSISTAVEAVSSVLSMYARQVASGLLNVARGLVAEAEHKLAGSSDPLETGKRLYRLLMEERLRRTHALLVAARSETGKKLRRHSDAVILTCAPNGPNIPVARKIAAGVAA